MLWVSRSSKDKARMSGKDSNEDLGRLTKGRYQTDSFGGSMGDPEETRSEEHAWTKHRRDTDTTPALRLDGELRTPRGDSITRPDPHVTLRKKARAEDLPPATSDMFIMMRILMQEEREARREEREAKETHFQRWVEAQQFKRGPTVRERNRG